MKFTHKKKFDLWIGGLAVFVLKPLVMFMGLLLRRPHDLEIRGRVLVMKLVGGGSLVLAQPALWALKKKINNKYPLVIVTTPSVAPFARELQLFDKIYIIDDRHLITLLLTTMRFVLSLVFRVDTCIDLEIHSRGTAILSLFTLARNRLGFFKETIYWRINLYTHLVFYNTYSCSSDFYNALISLFGVSSVVYDQAAEAFQKKYASQQQTQDWCLSFACSEHARERQLSPKQWVLALKKMDLTKDNRIVLLGSRREHAQAEMLKQEIELQTGFTCINECGHHDLGGTIERIAQSQKFLGIDSGLLHLARLLGKNTVSFWGPTDPRTRLTPRQKGEDSVYYNKVSCSPCVHFADTPPCQGQNRCIEAIFSPELITQSRSWAILAAKDLRSVEIKND